jgi:histidyl-tRNA synthetase
MAKVKPSIPKGTRDFPPAIMIRRNYIFNIIQKTFQKYTFLPLETPSMENLSTLTGKYGEEGDQLLFRILESGDFLGEDGKKIIESGAKDSEKLSASLRNHIARKGLRYDLTVPFARFVVQHRNEITFPFKRYQIQPVWRADKPQKGRYREFYQCDGDVIGSKSLLNEVELIQIMDEVFSKLNLDVTIKINNRKILKGLAEYIGQEDKFTDLTVAIDKLDKTGSEKVLEELRKRGISKDSCEKVKPFLELSTNKDDNLSYLDHIMNDSEEGLKGLDEIREIFYYLDIVSLNNKLEFDPKLARGLDYYTGTIFEVKSNEMKIGSICGGGRYDDLTGVFGLNDVSGVGISFGAERIYDVMNKMDKFSTQMEENARILFVNFGKEEAKYSYQVVQELRNQGIMAELFPDSVKMKKQFAYADQRKIPYVAIIGENEMKNNTITLKNMSSGEQKEVNTEDLIKELSSI